MSKYISVEEQLPALKEDGYSEYVSCIAGDHQIAHLSADGVWQTFDGKVVEPSHWSPLPEIKDEEIDHYLFVGLATNKDRTKEYVNAYYKTEGDHPTLVDTFRILIEQNEGIIDVDIICAIQNFNYVDHE